MAIKAGVGCQLLVVEPMTHHGVVSDVVRQMTDPAAHQIQHLGAGRDPFSVELRQTRPETRVEMMNKARLAVKQRVITAIQLVALGFLKYANSRHGSTQFEIPTHHARQLTDDAVTCEQFPEDRGRKTHHRGTTIEALDEGQRRLVPRACCGEGLTETLRLLVLESRSCHRSEQIQRTLTAVSGRLG